MPYHPDERARALNGLRELLPSLQVRDEGLEEELKRHLELGCVKAAVADLRKYERKYAPASTATE